MTQSADVLGTPSYMAPEQAHGKKGVMTTATDVYGLGGILYALLTGRPPFKGGTWVELLKYFEEGPERPSLSNANVDRDLEKICLKCLDKDPRQRYASAEQLADELQHYLNGEPLRHTRAVSRLERLRRWCSRKPMEASLAAAVLLVALLIPVGVISYLRAENSRGRELAARQLQYESDISFGYKLWAEGMDLDKLEKLLVNHVPASGEDDLRDKRWHHLKWLCDKSAPRTIDIKGPLFRFAMAPNGQIFATSGFDDKQVKIWQTAKGKLLHTLSDTGRVERLAFAGDNTTLATAHGTGRVKLWNATTGKLLGTLEHFSADDPHPIRGLAFGGKDGIRLATAGEDGIVKVWDVGRNALVDTFPFDAKTLTSMAFSPDGNILAIGTADGEVKVGALATKRQFSLKRTRQPFAHAGGVYSLAFAGDNTTLASGGDDRAIVVWELAGMDNDIQECAVFNGESEIVTALAYAKKERGMLASVSSDGALKVWNLNNATSKPAILKGHRDGLRAAAFFPDGMTLATASNDGIVKVWDLSQREEVLELVRRTEATPWMIGD